MAWLSKGMVKQRLRDGLVEQALDRTKKGTALKRAVPFFIDDDRLFGLTGRRVSVGMCAYLGRDACVPRSGYVRTSVGVRVYLGRGTMTIKPL